jgi:hypothetical protein
MRYMLISRGAETPNRDADQRYTPPPVLCGDGSHTTSAARSTLLIRLHSLQRLPETDGEAVVGMLDVLDQPQVPQAQDHCVRHGSPIDLPYSCQRPGCNFPQVSRIIMIALPPG